MTKEEHVEITGPVGRIEAVVQRASTSPSVGIVCHPHSLQGGTMQNKVVTTIFRLFRDLGWSAIRFNFRGVGNSAGQYDAGMGETADLLAVVDWLNHTVKDPKICLAGFSFGSYVAYRGAAQIPALFHLISVAPPINHFPFTASPLPSVPWTVVQGLADDVVPAAEVLAWLDGLSIQPHRIIFPDVGHFFHGQLTALQQSLAHILKEIC